MEASLRQGTGWRSNTVRMATGHGEHPCLGLARDDVVNESRFTLVQDKRPRQTTGGPGPVISALSWHPGYDTAGYP